MNTIVSEPMTITIRLVLKQNQKQFILMLEIVFILHITNLHGNLSELLLFHFGHLVAKTLLISPDVQVTSFDPI